MPGAVKWTEAAIQDVQNWVGWIRRDSEFQAGRVATAVLELVDDIARHPLTGHIVPELKDETMRFKIIYARRLVYEVRGEAIIIKRIISCRMDFMREFQPDRQDA